MRHSRGPKPSSCRSTVFVCLLVFLVLVRDEFLVREGNKKSGLGDFVTAAGAVEGVTTGQLSRKNAVLHLLGDTGE